MLNTNVNTKVLRDAYVSAKRFLAGAHDLRKVLRCVHWDFSKDGLTIVSTDGCIMLITQCGGESTEVCNFTVAAHHTGKVQEILKSASKSVTVAYDGETLSLADEKIDLFSDTKFPNWRRVIPKSPRLGAVNRQLFIETLTKVGERSCVCAGGKKCARLAVRDGRMLLSPLTELRCGVGVHSLFGEPAVIEMAAPEKLTNYTATFQVDYLLMVAKSIKTEQILLSGTEQSDNAGQSALLVEDSGKMVKTLVATFRD